jgi:hypothetical protein
MPGGQGGIYLSKAAPLPGNLYEISEIRSGPRKDRLWRLRRLEIRDQAVLFPIAIAGRIKAATAAGFFGLAGVAITLGAACRRFGQRAFGCRRKWALRGPLDLGGIRCRRAL